MDYNFYSQKYPDGNTYYHLDMGKLTDEEYQKLKPIIEMLGGHWREKYNCFVLNENAASTLRAYKATGMDIPNECTAREKIQFYPAPESVAKKVVDLAEIKPHQIVLNPYARIGDIADYLPQSSTVLCVDDHEAHIDILTSKGYVTCKMAFPDYYNSSIKYDRIVMNPPFANQEDIRSILMAWNMLDDGGILVSTLSENALYYHTPISDEFRRFRAKTNAEIVELPTNSFAESGSTIDAVIIKIKK